MLKPTVLVILDGWGVNLEEKGNAIAQAKTPVVDELDLFYPNCILQSSSLSVGLPWGEAGNSEVGHLNIGAGRIVYQDFIRISLAIQDERFFENKAILKAIDHVKVNKSAFHLIGLLSSASVHSHIDHLYALLELAKKRNLKKVFIHLFTDGRDSPPHQASTFLANLKLRLDSLGLGKIVSIQGRYYSMDRNKNWSRTQKAYQLLIAGVGDIARDPVKAIKDFYQKGITDEFIKPTLIANLHESTFANIRKSQSAQISEGLIKDNDAVVFFNFRADRARQLTQAFVEKSFQGFKRRKILKNLCFVTMTEYKKGLPVPVAFPPQKIRWPLARVISEAGLKQLHITETEKYAHLTYFFNGGQELPFEGEERILVPSPSVSHYDKTPEMSALKITNRVIEEIKKEKHHFIVINYANADMLGHTGNFSAALKAIEHIDSCLGQLIKEVLNYNGLLAITSDHGNAEEMLNLKTGEALTEHNDNPVPFWLVGLQYKEKKIQDKIKEQRTLAQGILADVAPTILELMALKKPKEMTGESLLPTLLGD